MNSEIKNIESAGAQLLPVNVVSKHLGIPKKGVQALISAGQLFSIDIAGKPYITAQSVTSLLGQKEQPIFGQQASGYPVSEELESPLTNNQLVEDTEKAGVSMAYKGSISTLADGRFMVQIDKGKKPDGKRDRESKSFRDKTEAESYLKKRLSELNAPLGSIYGGVGTTPIIPGVPQGNYTALTFEEYAKKVLNEGIGKGTSRTIESYRRGLVMIVPYIGKIPMAVLTTQDIKKALEKIRYKYAKSNIKRCFTTTRLILQNAVDNGDIPTDPMNKLKCPSSKKPVNKNPYPTYSDEDIKTIFETSKEYNFELYAMLTVLECTGMRPAELRALEWGKFSPETKTIRINQAITNEYEEIKDIKKTPKNKEVLSVTKSEYGVRTLPLSDIAVEALLAWEKRLRRSRNKLKANSIFMFPTKNGGFRTESASQSMLQRYRARFELEATEIYYYKFRHTMCTRLILAGQPIPVIQRIMGDNTTDVIMKIYTHVNEQMALESAKGFYDDMNRRHTQIAS